MSLAQTAYLLIVMPLLAALGAAGVVLALKTARRREAPAPRLDAVPTDPLPRGEVRRLWRNYARVAAIILALVALAGALLFL